MLSTLLFTAVNAYPNTHTYEYEYIPGDLLPDSERAGCLELPESRGARKGAGPPLCRQLRGGVSPLGINLNL